MKKYSHFPFLLVLVVLFLSGCGGSKSTEPKPPTDEELAAQACSAGWTAFLGADYITAKDKFNVALGYDSTKKIEATVGYYSSLIKTSSFPEAEITLYSMWNSRVTPSSVSYRDKSWVALLMLQYGYTSSTGDAWLLSNKLTLYNYIRLAGINWSFNHNGVELFNGSTAYILCAELLILKSNNSDSVSIDRVSGNETASENQKYDDLERAYHLLYTKQTVNPLHSLSTTTNSINTSMRTILSEAGFVF